MDCTGSKPLDCVIVGGGPAGLTAALYLARFRRRAMIVDAGASRAGKIPKCHNVTGYDEGIAGGDLIARMVRHAAQYGALFQKTKALRLHRLDGVFLVDVEGATLTTRTVILATGVSDHPPLPYGIDHDAATLAGSLRYCPVCDGFEAIGKRVAVLGGDDHAVAEALFLRTYVSDLTLLSPNALDVSSSGRRQLHMAGVSVIEQPVTALAADDAGVRVTLDQGQRLEFEMLYVALGCSPHTQLARGVGAEITPGGSLATDDHMETTVPGLYAAGDVVEGLNQISVAAGQAAIAATAIHKVLSADWEAR